MYSTNTFFTFLTSFILLWCSVGAVQEAQAQCQAQITSITPTGTVCPNDPLTFTGTGQGVATSFNFNGSTFPTGWVASAFTLGQPCATPSSDGTDYFWSAAGAFNVPRFVQTNTIDASLGGNLIFTIDFGNDDPDPGCEQVDATEGIFLQYSIDAGTSWVDIQYFDPTDPLGGAIGYNWVPQNTAIPIAAQTASTMFRWIQVNHSGTGFDNWGLDNISVTQTVTTTDHSWDFGDGSPLDTSGGTVSHIYTATGVYTVTYQATVVGGCTNSTTTTVNIAVVSPTITAPANINVNTDLGICTASSVALGTPTVLGGCGGVTSSNNAPVTFPIGNTTVTWTVVDGNGSTATATQTVTVSDNQPPTIIAPTDVTVNTDLGICTASSVALGTATGTDNCGTPTFTSNAPTTFPIGNTTVTWTANDGNGNTATATQTVTVLDAQPPVVTVPADITVNATVGTCNAVVNYAAISANDNCSGGVGGLGNILFVSDNAGATEIETALLAEGYSVTAVYNDFVGGNNATLQGTLSAYDLIYWNAVGTGSGNTHNAATFTNLNAFVAGGGSVFVTGYDVIVSPTDNNMISFLGGTSGIDVPGLATAPLNGPNSLTTGFANIVGMTITQPNGDHDHLTGLSPSVTVVLQGSSADRAEWSINNVAGGEIAWVSSGQSGTNTFPAWTTLGSGYHEALLNFAFNFSGTTSSGTTTLNQTAGLASGSTFPIGTTTNTFTATDAAGNITTESFTVTVVDSREIDVLGNTVSIVDGDVTPSVADDTNFGNVVTSSTKTYTITNTGTDAITISSITSDNTDFAVVLPTPTTVAAGGGIATFGVTFTPTSIGTQTATITINNNDCNEGVYDFVVQGRKNPPTRPSPPVPLPPLPIDFTATAVSTTQINLEWDLSYSPNITSYRIYQGSVLIATLPRSATTFEVLGLTPDTFYSYHLIAVNQIGSDTKISNPVFDNDWTFPEAPILGSVSAVCGSGQASALLTSTAFIYNVYESLTALTPLLQTDGNNNFALPSVSQTTTFYISVLGKDPVNVKESERIAVTVEVEPTFEATILGESSQVSCESSLVLEAEEVENATYIWLRNSVAIATGQSFTATSSGDYQVVIQRGVCRFTSDKVSVKLNFAPIANIQQGNQGRFCNAGTLTAIQTNTDATYEWILNGTTVGQGTSISVSESGLYTLQVTQSGCQASTEINVVVAPTPQTPILEATESTICPNAETTISVQNAENGVIYQWFRNGRNLRQTGTSLSTSIQGDYQARAISTQNAFCSTVSEELSINHFEVLPVYLRVSEDKTSLFVEDINLSQAEVASVEWYFEGEINASLGTTFEITPTEKGRYSARVTNLNGCVIQTRTVYFTPLEVVTGEEDVTITDVFKIYPNPSTGAFKIQFPIVLTENIQMTVFDAIGRAIHTQQLEKGKQGFSINIEGISKGMYMIHFNQNGSTYSKQIIIE